MQNHKPHQDTNIDAHCTNSIHHLHCPCFSPSNRTRHKILKAVSQRERHQRFWRESRRENEAINICVPLPETTSKMDLFYFIWMEIYRCVLTRCSSTPPIGFGLTLSRSLADFCISWLNHRMCVNLRYVIGVYLFSLCVWLDRANALRRHECHDRSFH